MSNRHVIERLGHLGDGVAPGPIYAPMVLPGETVTGTLSGERLGDIKIVMPSPDRIKAVCPHFKACGGCNLQHASDEFLKDWKVQMVTDALAFLGLSAVIEMVSVSPAASRRRATFSGRRTKKDALVGLHARASATIVDIPDCKLLHPDLIAAIPALRELTVLGASRKNEISLSLTLSDAGLDLHVMNAKPLDGNLRLQLAALAERSGFARLNWNDELVAEIIAPAQYFGSVRVVPPAGAFLQATQAGQDALIRSVLRAVNPAKKVVDLFAGCGTFSLALAHVAEVFAVESSAQMLQALDTGWRHASGLKNVTTQERDLFRRPLLPDELGEYAAIVIDPPRSGAESQFREIAKASVNVVAAVSCNPVSFARDAKILCDAGFEIDWIDVVDQFRWSPHVELVALFSRGIKRKK